MGGLPKGVYSDFILPPDYVAGERAYSKAFIDTLVRREVAPWEDIFPDQIADLDIERLRAAIADILHHEIYARHGYAFVIGKYTGRPGHEPSGVSIAPAKTMFGKWYGYFTTYSLHGGWYRPDRDKTMEEVKAELRRQELANLAFLAQHDATPEEATSSNQ